ncbi:DUF1361 domain-containing protein [Foetidibacter luteolus]|uniref:DUF1361 domain-containing protein n=1 Tax=Foetidibacter luteolus TaxID=2608880 RepID=UPI00129A4E1D|nr:DUF1361 domain-containing protein [Foetidibacter luteolus]
MNNKINLADLATTYIKPARDMKKMKKLTNVEKTLLLSIGFTLVLLAARLAYTRSMAYMFYPWNFFLAIVPLLFSRRLQAYTSMGLKPLLLMGGWLLFFPNAPYIVTDVFHFEQRAPIPYWYDLLLVISGAWNGLILGFVSWMQVESYLARQLKPVWLKITSSLFIILAGYGVYVGRYLRYNSWNIVTKPTVLLKSSAKHVLIPQQYLQVWAFTFAFSAMLFVVYYTIRILQKQSFDVRY